MPSHEILIVHFWACRWDMFSSLNLNPNFTLNSEVWAGSGLFKNSITIVWLGVFFCKTYEVLVQNCKVAKQSYKTNHLTIRNHVSRKSVYLEGSSRGDVTHSWHLGKILCWVMHKDTEEKVLMKKKQSTSTLNLACHFTFLRADRF